MFAVFARPVLFPGHLRTSRCAEASFDSCQNNSWQLSLWSKLEAAPKQGQKRLLAEQTLVLGPNNAWESDPIEMVIGHRLERNLRNVHQRADNCLYHNDPIYPNMLLALAKSTKFWSISYMQPQMMIRCLRIDTGWHWLISAEQRPLLVSMNKWMDGNISAENNVLTLVHRTQTDHIYNTPIYVGSYPWPLSSVHWQNGAFFNTLCS